MKALIAQLFWLCKRIQTGSQSQQLEELVPRQKTAVLKVAAHGQLKGCLLQARVDQRPLEGIPKRVRQLRLAVAPDAKGAEEHPPSFGLLTLLIRLPWMAHADFKQQGLGSSPQKMMGRGCFMDPLRRMDRTPWIHSDGLCGVISLTCPLLSLCYYQ